MMKSAVEKWTVMVRLTQRMKDQFSDEELLTFAKVLAIYTLPDGEPISGPIADRTKNVLADEEMIRAYVCVTGVADTTTTFEAGRLYWGATLTQEHAVWPSGQAGMGGTMAPDPGGNPGNQQRHTGDAG